MKITNEEDNHRNRVELEKLSVLLEKYIKGDCTEEEQQAIEAWYETLAGEREPKTSDEISAKQRIWAEIRPTSESRDAKHLKVMPHQRLWLRWAASITILCVSSVFAFMYMQKRQIPLSVAGISAENWTVQSNLTAHDMRLVLSDSSRIILKPDAIIGYPETFNASVERLVTLSGEAFFEIERDVERPFKVITGDITTRVLGTSFNVKAIDQQSVIEVDVRTGKVSVYEHNHTDSTNTEGVVLTPNQKVTYYKNEKKWVAELVSDPLPVEAGADEASALVFKDDQMRSVLQRIASIYSIEIIVVNEAVYDCPFTGDISNMELYDMLKLICKSIGSTYEVRGTRILIEGAGCR